MRCKDHGITCSQDGDGIGDDRRRWIVGGSDGGHDAEGSVFHQGQPIIAGIGPGVEILHPRGAGGAEEVLLRLVSHASHHRLLHRHAGPLLRVGDRTLAQGRDDGSTQFQTLLLENPLRLSRGGNGGVRRGIADKIFSRELVPSRRVTRVLL